MAKIDENQEAVAWICTEVNKYDEYSRRKILRDAEAVEVPEPTEETRCKNWKLGAPDRVTTARELGEMVFTRRNGDVYKKFDHNLKDFLLKVLPDCLSKAEDLKVRNDFNGL